ncbi:hypothetical protein Hanom_Chr12g01134041 [Helianthus anomalus]
MATIYEETYKYVMFLKAQISVLESMPNVSSSSSSSLPIRGFCFQIVEFCRPLAYHFEGPLCLVIFRHRHHNGNTGIL